MRLGSKTLALAPAIIAFMMVSGSNESDAGFIMGSQVTGMLNFNGMSSPNYFDPTVGNVPVGYLNAAGPNVTIADPVVEFGYRDGSNTDTANFSGVQLVITDIVTSAAGPFTMTFIDPAIASLALISSNFPGLTGSISGDIITISSSINTNPGTYTASFSIGSNAVPEPSSLALTATAAVLALATGLQRRRVARARILV